MGEDLTKNPEGAEGFVVPETGREEQQTKKDYKEIVWKLHGEYSDSPDYRWIDAVSGKDTGYIERKKDAVIEKAAERENKRIIEIPLSIMVRIPESSVINTADPTRGEIATIISCAQKGLELELYRKIVEEHTDLVKLNHKKKEKWTKKHPNTISSQIRLDE